MLHCGDGILLSFFLLAWLVNQISCQSKYPNRSGLLLSVLRPVPQTYSLSWNVTFYIILITNSDTLKMVHLPTQERKHTSCIMFRKLVGEIAALRWVELSVSALMASSSEQNALLFFDWKLLIIFSAGKYSVFPIAVGPQPCGAAQQVQAHSSANHEKSKITTEVNAGAKKGPGFIHKPSFDNMFR